MDIKFDDIPQHRFLNYIYSIRGEKQDQQFQADGFNRPLKEMNIVTSKLYDLVTQEYIQIQTIIQHVKTEVDKNLKQNIFDWPFSILQQNVIYEVFKSTIIYQITQCNVCYFKVLLYQQKVERLLALIELLIKQGIFSPTLKL